MPGRKTVIGFFVGVSLIFSVSHFGALADTGRAGKQAVPEQQGETGSQHGMYPVAGVSLLPNTNAMLRKDGAYYSISRKEGLFGTKISYFYCLAECDNAENVFEGELDNPPTGESMIAVIGNERIRYKYVKLKQRSGEEFDYLCFSADEFDISTQISSMGVVKSKKQFMEQIVSRNESGAWSTPESRAKIAQECPEEGRLKQNRQAFFERKEKKHLLVPIQRVIAISNCNKKACIIFSGLSEESSVWLRKIKYEWIEIEKTDAGYYTVISKGNDELYERDRSKPGPQREKTNIEIGNFRLVWSYRSRDEGGYLYYYPDEYTIEITESATFDEYLEGLRKE